MKKNTFESLVQRYEKLTVWERITQFYKDFGQQKILVTSSFGANSAVLLYLMHKYQPEQTIHFINTTFLFPETLQYKDYLAKEWDLKLSELLPNPIENQVSKQQQLWQNNPDRCCLINKVQTLSTIKSQHDCWISGLRADQTSHRKNLQLFEEKDGLLRFYPLLDMTQEEVELFFKVYELPVHPLAEKGYSSIGCIFCTQKGKGRSGRWQNSSKKECGLHL